LVFYVSETNKYNPYYFEQIGSTVFDVDDAKLSAAVLR